METPVGYTDILGRRLSRQPSPCDSIALSSPHDSAEIKASGGMRLTGVIYSRALVCQETGYHVCTSSPHTDLRPKSASVTLRVSLSVSLSHFGVTPCIALSGYDRNVSLLPFTYKISLHLLQSLWAGGGACRGGGGCTIIGGTQCTSSLAVRVSVPRLVHCVVVSFVELLDTRTIRPFSFSFNTSDYRILHMDQDQGRLYLGTREYLVALDMQNINKEPLIPHPIAKCHTPLLHTTPYCYKSRPFYDMPRPIAKCHTPLSTGQSALKGKGNVDWRVKEGRWSLSFSSCNYDNFLSTGRVMFNIDDNFLSRVRSCDQTLPPGSEHAERPTDHPESPPASLDKKGECANFVRLIEPWNRTHLYTCGTGAYKPICTFINRGWRAEEYLFRLVPGYVDSGKGKCSYDPRQENAAALINGNLYAGVHVDFMGTDFAIFRTLGDRPAVRTEQHDSRWLNEPVFVKIQRIPDSTEKNDDKLYFFFREKSLDSGGGASPTVLARVGRVCLNDDGGQRSLVNKWTTFLKAHLVCSVIGGDDGVETYFHELRDVFIQSTQDERNPIVYAVFSSAGSVFKGSAVCVYSMADIRNVFNGPFSHKQGHSYQWTPYTGKIPYPRPGTCPGGTFTPGFRSTKEFSDEAVNFVRAHPLMYHPVYPVHRRPLVVRTGVDYRFTTIAVDQVDAVDGRYEVLFLGTGKIQPTSHHLPPDRGTVQKVIVLPKDPHTTEELILEEVEVFRIPAPVKTMKISSKRVKHNDVLRVSQQQLYVSSERGLTQVSLHRCAVYGKACSDCCLARDPYCAWDGENCAPFTAAAKRRSRRQDIKHGDPLRQCRGFNAKVETRLQETVQFGVEGSSAFLECQPRSPQASVKWLLQKDGRRKLLNRERGLVKTGQGILLKSLSQSDSGVYHCLATENKFKHTVARVVLRILDREIVEALTTPDSPPEHQRHPHPPPPPPPPQTLPPQPHPHPEVRLIQQYCQSYWGQIPSGPQPKRTNRRHTDSSVDSHKSH
ncbi:hypothetical protein JZ751_021762 [Albula glossodonta]|uniref:Uncharacterized protein n=1 Tax=Albula glossodonta TaxID=121402 RepID=A0A8T2NIU8_9TELE|nr:hypothetical protein JZ751_021762 [Albula glossodonta]